MNKLENIVSAVVGVTVVVLVLLVWQRAAVERILIRSDLQDYGQAVRRAGIALADKERLLDHIDSVEDRLEQGKSIGYLRWRRTDSIVRELLEDGIHGDDVQLLERELERVENLLQEE
jgi:hypothetical protein